MSTRSGKRIHISFHENIVKSETDFTRSERKTKSKHSKENFDELNVSSKVKKRNYVAYPADDDAGLEPSFGVDTVDSKNEEKSKRLLRKNALKERNTTSTESVEPAVDIRKSVRSTRKTRKYDENSRETPEVAPQDKELTKSKKGRKKKVEQEQVVEVTLVVPKKKSKKKKDKRSSSMVVEDVELKTQSGLNKSNMSIDSFHSAASSPQTCNIEAVNSTYENNDNDKSDARKTRSSLKLEVTSENAAEQKPRKRKTSIKVKLDRELKDVTLEKEKINQDSTLNREIKKRKCNARDDDETKGDEKTFIVLESTSTPRESLKNASFDKVATSMKINRTFEKEELKAVSTQKNKNKSIVDEFIKVVLQSPESVKDASFDIDSVTGMALIGMKKKPVLNASSKVTKKPSPLMSAEKENKINSKANDTIDINMSNPENMSIIDATFNLDHHSAIKASQMKLLTEDTKKISIVNTTYEKDSETDTEFVKNIKSSIVDVPFDLTSPLISAVEVSKTTDDLKCNIIDTTYEKNCDAEEDQKSVMTTLPKVNTKINTTFEKDSNENKKTSKINNKRPTQKETDINSTFNIDQEKKLDSTFNKSSKSSLLSSDNSMITLDKSDTSKISITSDESKTEENILNSTPVLIESSLDESQMNTTKTPTKQTTPLKTGSAPAVTPLKREGTFTKDEPEVMAKTPMKRLSLPSPGFTPFHINKSSAKEKMLNVTRSIEKRRSSLAEPARATKVMFCSPVNNPAVVSQNRRKVIKSNLKGSNKSFVFDDSVSQESRPATRKRSYTQSDADDARVKRKRLADELQQSVDRLSRPRTSSASAKLAEPTTPSKKHATLPKKPTTPSKQPTTPSKKPTTTPSKKSEAKVLRTKLPNFAVLHQKQFAKMESLNDCQARKAKRAKLLLTPTGAVSMLERISPTDRAIESEKPKEAPEKPKAVPKDPETPIKSLPTFKSLNPGYTRFGFKLNLDVNPFSIPSKTQPKPKENKPNGLTREPTVPSLTGATSLRREVAKQTVMREKSFTDRRNVKRTENRTVIKGVRTNRRFELQMRMRNI